MGEHLLDKDRGREEERGRDRNLDRDHYRGRELDHDWDLDQVPSRDRDREWYGDRSGGSGGRAPRNMERTDDRRHTSSEDPFSHFRGAEMWRGSWESKDVDDSRFPHAPHRDAGSRMPVAT